MATTAWDGGLETGYPPIDEQHRDLVAFHAVVLEHVRSGDAGAAWAELQELIDHTQRHFAYEEARMIESAYGAREKHLEGHRAFMGDLVQLVERARLDACAPVVRMWLESRYVSWWKYHVRSSDAALAAHLAAAQSIPPAQPEPPATPGDKALA